MGTGGNGGGGGAGGGIVTTNTLTLTRVALTGNVAGNGGNGGTGDGGNGGFSTTSSPPGIGGQGRGGHGGSGGGGGGVAILAGVTTIVDSTLSDDAAGRGGTRAQGTGGIGGLSTVGNGGEGGTGSGGWGGAGGAGGAVLVSSGVLDIARSFISGAVAGSGGPAADGQGERGGNSSATGSVGGKGGQGLSGLGGGGGSGGAVAVVFNGAATITSSTLVGSRTGSGGPAAAAKGGSGGNGPGDGTGGAGGGAVSPSGGNAGPGGALGALGGLDGSGQLLNSTIAGNQLGTVGASGSAVGGTGGNGGSSGTPGSSEVATAPSAPEGGAVRVYGLASGVTVRNTVLAGNAAPACGSFQAPADGGHNLVFPAAGGCPGTVLDPLLAPAADNGGPTLTLRPAPGSPAIDGGADCAPTDQRSVARPQGVACDIGAYEWASPSVSTGVPTEVTTTTATLSGDVNPNARATMWHIEYGPTAAYGTSTPDVAAPAGVAIIPVAVPVTGLAAATTYHFRLVASNADGVAVTADRTFTTTAAPGRSGGPGGTGGGPGGSQPDRVAPRFLAASLRPTTFAVVPVPRRKTRAAQGTTFRFTLSAAARVVVTIERATPGRRVGTSCRKPTRTNRRGKRCTRFTGARRFTVSGRAGANTHRFTGRIGRRALPVASYRARLVATDAAGNRSAPRDLRFRIVRAR